MSATITDAQIAQYRSGRINPKQRLAIAIYLKMLQLWALGGTDYRTNFGNLILDAQRLELGADPSDLGPARLAIAASNAADAGADVPTDINTIVAAATRLGLMQVPLPTLNRVLISLNTKLGMNADQMSVNDGYDPVLGPPFPPVGYQLYVDRHVDPSDGILKTFLTWTVPDILLSAVVTAPSPPDHRITITVNNYTNFPAKTTETRYWKRPWDSDYVVLGTTVNNNTTDSGTTTAAMADNGNGTSTVTLAGGSYTFDTDPVWPNGPGAVLHWDDGQEAVIISITDTTHALVNGGATKAAQQFTMYDTRPLSGSAVDIETSPNISDDYIVSIYLTRSATVNGVTRTLTSNLYPVTVPA